MADTKELRKLLAEPANYARIANAAVNALPDLLDTQDMLVEALRFYADVDNYNTFPFMPGSLDTPVENDGGKLARAALAKVGK